MLGPFHVVNLGLTCLDNHRHAQHDTTVHRSRTGDPLFGIRRGCAGALTGSLPTPVDTGPPDRPRRDRRDHPRLYRCRLFAFERGGLVMLLVLAVG